MRRPAHGQLGLARPVILEQEGREHVAWPSRRHRMHGDAARFVGKAAYCHDAVFRINLAEHPLAPHRRAVRRAQHVVVHAADAEIELRYLAAEALGAEPLLKPVSLGESLPHQFARRLERAGYDEVLGLTLGAHGALLTK